MPNQSRLLCAVTLHLGAHAWFPGQSRHYQGVSSSYRRLRRARYHYAGLVLPSRRAAFTFFTGLGLATLSLLGALGLALAGVGTITLIPPVVTLIILTLIVHRHYPALRLLRYLRRDNTTLGNLYFEDDDLELIPASFVDLPALCAAAVASLPRSREVVDLLIDLPFSNRSNLFAMLATEPAANVLTAADTVWMHPRHAALLLDLVRTHLSDAETAAVDAVLYENAIYPELTELNRAFFAALDTFVVAPPSVLAGVLELRSGDPDPTPSAATALDRVQDLARLLDLVSA